MMRSLYSAVGGLRNHQTRMDVIGNNIANVNTTGFKSGRASFQDILTQNGQIIVNSTVDEETMKILQDNKPIGISVSYYGDVTMEI